MIRVTRLNDSQLFVNAEMIQFVEETPDTVISLVGGKKIVVCETAEEIVQAVTDYRRRVNTPVVIVEAGE